MPEISVIIPNYNHAPFLKERIDTVLAQSYTDFEVIILDDCSNDNSREIIEACRDNSKVKHIIFNEVNSGSPFKQWQKGIELATGKWIWIAESDDIADSRFLQEAWNAISNNPSASIFYCDAEINDGENIIGERKKFSTYKNAFFSTQKWSADHFVNGADEINDYLGIYCIVNNASSALLKRSVLADQLAKLVSFRFHGDWFSYIHLASKGNIFYSAKVLNTYRSSSSGVRPGLPENGKNKAEYFKILEYMLSNDLIKNKQLFLRKFVRLHLDCGILKERKDWRQYFTINKMLARKVFYEMIRNRFIPGKKNNNDHLYSK